MKKILIIGASGFLGAELYKVFSLDKNYSTYGTYFKSVNGRYEYLNVLNKDSIEKLLCKIVPDIVIVTSALTNVEYCEANRDEAYKINVAGVKNVVDVCKKYKSKIIYISTEYVFDGKQGPYSENDMVNPINYYGETKLMAEKIIQKEIDNYLIIRTTVVYGWNVDSKNFIMQLIKNLNENKSMKVPIDQVSSPTYCPNLSQMIKECCDKNILGILNLVGNDVMDRYDFAVKAAKILNLNKDLLIPVKTDVLGQMAKRPLNAGLKVNKVLEILNNKPENVLQSLNEIKNIYEKYKNQV